MSLVRQTALQMNKSIHTSSLHKSQIMFVFKYFLPRLQNVWRDWERVTHNYKDSHLVKPSLLKTNCIYQNSTQANSAVSLPSVIAGRAPAPPEQTKKDILGFFSQGAWNSFHFHLGDSLQKLPSLNHFL